MVLCIYNNYLRIDFKMKELNINELTVEQKIGQLICVRKFIDKDDEAFIFDMLRKKAVGAIQVNYFDGVKEFIKRFHHHLFQHHHFLQILFPLQLQ